MFDRFSEDEYNQLTSFEDFSTMELDIDATDSMSDEEIDARELESMIEGAQ